MEMQLQSETTSDLVKALVSATAEIKTAKRDAENPFFKSKYADLPTVVEACKGALLKNNLVVTQSTTIINGQTTLVTTLHHSSGQWIRGYYPVTAVKSDPQGIGSAMTYARRYALAALVGIVSDDDDDGETAMGRNGGFSRRAEFDEEPVRIPNEAPAKSHQNPPDGSIDWRGVAIHFGKQKGVALGTLNPKSLSWWIREWTPQPYKGKTSPQDELLRSALDQAALEVEESLSGQDA
jgi:hypothetical protein